MSETATIEAQERTERGTRTAQRMREGGVVPANLSVPGGPSRALKLDAVALKRLVDGGAHLVTLKVGAETDTALLKDVQYDALDDHIIHADFVKVNLEKEIHIEVEVRLKGKPVGVTEQGGVLVQYVHHIEVACLPTAIPAALEVDVSELTIGHSVHAARIVLPEGVRLIRTDIGVAGVEAKIEEVVEPAAAAAVEGEGVLGAAPAEPEVIKKERKTEEDEEPE